MGPRKDTYNKKTDLWYFEEEISASVTHSATSETRDTHNAEAEVEVDEQGNVIMGRHVEFDPSQFDSDLHEGGHALPGSFPTNSMTSTVYDTYGTATFRSRCDVRCHTDINVNPFNPSSDATPIQTMKEHLN